MGYAGIFTPSNEKTDEYNNSEIDKGMKGTERIL